MSPPAPSLLGQLLGLAWPVVLARLGIMGMAVADTVMVGQMAPAELADQALGGALMGPFLVAGIGLLTGVQVLGARAVGEGRPAHAGAVMRLGLILGLAVGVACCVLIWAAGEGMLTLFGVQAQLTGPSMDVARILAISIPLNMAYVACAFYLEAIQRPTAAAVVIWSANLLNIAVNAALIPSMGAEGSAWATVLSRGFMFMAVLAWIVTRPEARANGVFGPPVGATAPAPNMNALLNVGVAAAISQLAEAGAFSAMTIIAGRIGAEQVAAYSILLNLLAVVFMIAMGVATATSVLTSEAVGRRDMARARAASWGGIGLNALFMVAAAVLVFVFADALARAYTVDPVLIALTASVMWVAALAIIPDGGQVVAAAALRARKDNWFPTASHILAYVLVMPPLAWWLAEVQGQGVAGLLAAIFWASVVSIGVLCARLMWLDRRVG